MKHFSTDLDRDNFCYPDKPEEAKHLRWMILTGILLGIVPLALVIAFADKIDSFLNTLPGALLISGVFGIMGVWWFISRIKKWME